MCAYKSCAGCRKPLTKWAWCNIYGERKECVYCFSNTVATLLHFFDTDDSGWKTCVNISREIACCGSTVSPSPRLLFLIGTTSCGIFHLRTGLLSAGR